MGEGGARAREREGGGEERRGREERWGRGGNEEGPEGNEGRLFSPVRR